MFCVYVAENKRIFIVIWVGFSLKNQWELCVNVQGIKMTTEDAKAYLSKREIPQLFEVSCYWIVLQLHVFLFVSRFSMEISPTVSRCHQQHISTIFRVWWGRFQHNLRTVDVLSGEVKNRDLWMTSNAQYIAKRHESEFTTETCTFAFTVCGSHPGFTAHVVKRKKQGQTIL